MPSLIQLHARMHTLGMRLRSLAQRLPSQCALCHAWPSCTLCEACIAQFAQAGPRCRHCALRVPEGVSVCGECLKNAPPLDLCLAAFDYAWPWTQCITAFKFQHQPGWAAPLTQRLCTIPGAHDALKNADCVIPMPLHPSRLRERGFNQSWELARRLPAAHHDAHLLLRLRDTPAQAGLNRTERLRNLRGAFAVEPLRARQVRDRRVILVDDVMTTGASLSTAAQALREAGAAHITALVLARTA